MVITRTHPIDTGRGILQVLTVTLLGISIVGWPLLYLLLVHTYIGCDFYMDGICAKCGKLYFDATDVKKKEDKRREIHAAKNKAAFDARIILEAKTGKLFKSMRNSERRH